jgi:hypothetical protein
MHETRGKGGRSGCSARRAQEQMRAAGDPEPRLHRRAQRRQVGRFDRDAERTPRVLQRADRSLAETARLFSTAIGRGSRSSRAGSPYQAIAACMDPRRITRRCEPDHDIELAPFELRDEFGGAGNAGIDLRFGMKLGELRQHPGQQHFGEILNHADPGRPHKMPAVTAATASSCRLRTLRA